VSISSSICIVSHNRKKELQYTLDRILDRIDADTEIIVGLDGCTDDSNDLQSEYANVIWLEFPSHIGASAARRKVYENAKGDYIFGFDDDSHPVTIDFVQQTIQIFHSKPMLGVIAFRIFNGIQLPETHQLGISIGKSYACSEFAGCGYAITRKAYQASGGFPQWINIYGEEAYVSIRAFEKGYWLSYEPSILVHHRINKDARKSDGYQKFRFGLQLRNNLVFFMKLYPFPLNIRSVCKCALHNLFKYGIKSPSWHIIFWKSFFAAFVSSVGVYERIIPTSVLKEWKKLPLPVFDWIPPQTSHV